MRRWALLALLIFAGSVCTQESEVGPTPLSDDSRGVRNTLASFERFSLFTECAPVFPFVFVLGELNDETLDPALTDAVSVRLQAAGINGEIDAPTSLRVLVEARDGGLSISIQFHKLLRDEFSGDLGQAVTWTRSALGTMGDGATAELLRFAHDLTAQFVVDYLRVNRNACE